MLFSTVLAAAIIASTQAAITGEGTFAGKGFMKIATAYKEEEDKGDVYKSASVQVAFGAKEVTFTDNAWFTTSAVWCLPNGTTDKFYCAMNTVKDPLDTKVLTFDVWKSTSKVTFKDTESLAITLGEPDCTATYTGDTVGGESSCSLTDKISLSINTDEKSFVDATSFTIPVVITDTSITSETLAAFEEGVTKNFDGFWGATQIYTGSVGMEAGTRTTVQGDNEKLTVAGASAIGAIAAAIAFIAAF